MSSNRNPSPNYGITPAVNVSASDINNKSTGYAFLDDRVTPPRAVVAGSQRLQNISPHSPSVSPLYRQSSPATSASTSNATSVTLAGSGTSPSMPPMPPNSNKSPGHVVVQAGIATLRSNSNSNRIPTPTQIRNVTSTERRMSDSASRALKLANIVREVSDPKFLTTKQNGEPRAISRRKQRKHDNKDLKHVFQVLSKKDSARSDIEGGRWIDEIMAMDRSQLLGIISSHEVSFSTVLGALFDDKSNADILYSFRKCEDAKFGIGAGKKNPRGGKYRRTHGIVVEGSDRIENDDGVDITELAWMNIERKLRHMMIDLIKQNPASMIEIICIIETIVFRFYRVGILGEEAIASNQSKENESSSSSGGNESKENESSSSCSSSSVSVESSATLETNQEHSSENSSSTSLVKLAMTTYGNPESTAFMQLSTDSPDDPPNCIRVTTKCPRNRVLFHGISQFYSINSETIVGTDGEKIVRLHFKEKSKTVATLMHHTLLSNALLQWVRKSNKSS